MNVKFKIDVIVIPHCVCPVPPFTRNMFTSKLVYVLNIFYECLLFLEDSHIVTLGLFLNKLLPICSSLQSCYPTFELGIPQK